jgi:hypothetical protein
MAAVSSPPLTISTRLCCEEILRDIIDDALVLCVHPPVPNTAQRYRWVAPMAEGRWRLLPSGKCHGGNEEGNNSCLNGANDDYRVPSWSAITGGTSSWTASFRTGFVQNDVAATDNAGEGSSISSFGCVAVPAAALPLFDLAACGVSFQAEREDGRIDAPDIECDGELPPLRRVAPMLHYFTEAMTFGNCGGGGFFGGAMGEDAPPQRIRVSYSVSSWKPAVKSAADDASHAPVSGWVTSTSEKAYFRKSLQSLDVEEPYHGHHADGGRHEANLLNWPLLYLRPTLSDPMKGPALHDNVTARWFEVADLVESVGCFLDAKEITCGWSQVNRLTWFVCRESAIQLTQRVDSARFRDALACSARWAGPPRPARAVRALLRHPLVPPQYKILEEGRLAVGLIAVIDTSPVEVRSSPSRNSHRHQRLDLLAAARRSTLRRGLERLLMLGYHATGELLYDQHSRRFRNGVLLAATITIKTPDKSLVVVGGDSNRQRWSRGCRVLGPLLCTTPLMVDTFMTHKKQLLQAPSVVSVTNDSRRSAGVRATVDVWSHPLNGNDDDTATVCEERWDALGSLSDGGGALPLTYETASWELPVQPPPSSPFDGPQQQHEESNFMATTMIIKQWTRIALAITELQQKGCPSSGTHRSYNAM